MNCVPGVVCLVLTVTLVQGQGDMACCPEECPCLDTIEFGSTKDILRIQPIYYNLVPNTPVTRLVDNVCETFFPLAEDPNASIIYSSVVLKDGSNQVTSHIRNYLGNGLVVISALANIGRIGNHYFLGHIGCDSYFKYNCVTRAAAGDCTQYCGTMVTSRTKLTKTCLEAAQQLIDDNGLDVDLDDYLQLPMNLPSRCITQQMSLLTNPFH